ncbi:LacI family DNA-binding transcriptional regulator [Microbacterium sp. CCNWLW134]|uniref:LacI family DNA-binding transcriptional regulator n=1 Tax=Microbacterium sp. CCNWLW134 TaxID=3122064 RepID=UPI00300FD998
MTRPTRNDVARRAGVSTAVVSYVLNDGPRPVAAPTRARVLRAIEDLGYRPNASARALKLARTGVIGLFVPDIANPFFAAFAQHVQDQAQKRDLAVMIGNTGLDPDREETQLGSIIERQVDGLIAFGIKGAAQLDRLITSGIPLVSMDWQLQDGSVPTIVADDYGAARTVIEHLIGHGHQQIAFIGGPEDLQVSGARRDAWRAAVLPGLDDAAAQHLAVSTEFSLEGGYNGYITIHEQLGRHPQALFASSDVQAIGAIRAATDLGLSVPSDLAVVSFDGTQVGQFSVPSLTAVRLPLELMAEHALQKVLQGPGKLGLHSTVPHTLVVGESCGCARQRRQSVSPDSTSKAVDEDSSHLPD